ncbi:MAG: DNA topoisomerase III, partial [Comamonadaceae bacterium]|nr:DNA topoisomerase III [Comamonadaceae bacterium]
FLAWDKEAGKVNFEFEPRASKFPPRKTAAGAPSRAAPAKKAAAKKAPAVKKTAAAKTPKAPRKTTAATGKQPSAALAAVIGEGAVSRPEVVKKLWDYIKANGLQDAADKRRVNADAKLAAVFGKPQVTMFEIAGLLGPHLN